MLAASSLTNSDWYLMRASGVVALVLLTGVFVLGIATFRRWRPGKLPRFVTASLHRSMALLSVVFLTIHVVSAIADPYAVVGVSAAFVPFVAGRSAFWVGLGAISLDLIIALVVSSLLRARISAGAWRAIHWVAYASWPLALAHTIGYGTDAGTLWLRAISIACIAAVLSSIAWRLGAANVKHLEPRRVSL
jgi:sulfoxide reductase heme-binding subunit YedZ